MAVSRNDGRQAAIAALQSLSKWHDEVAAANERCLGDVLDQTAAAARAVGWPGHVINAIRDQLLNASQLQTQAIDQLTALWKKQLESPTSPMPVARSLSGPTPRLPSSNYPRFNAGNVRDRRPAIYAPASLGADRRDVAAELDLGDVVLGGFSRGPIHPGRPECRAVPLCGPALVRGGSPRRDLLQERSSATVDAAGRSTCSGRLANLGV
jgi:hypothetical protein